MKKILLISLIILIIAAAAGCYAQSTPEGSNSGYASPLSSAETVSQLLSGYPLDTLPLYEAFSIDSSSFSCRGSDDYAIGKDIYSVTFQSAADSADVYGYYSGILTETVKNDTQDEYDVTDALSGKIGENGVEVNILDNGDNTSTVYLTYGLTKDKYTDQNPFFADYPADVLETYGYSMLMEQTVEVSYIGEKSTIYSTLYKTDRSKEDFSSYYSSKYGQEQEFASSEGGSRITFSWQHGEYQISASYTEGKTNYISLAVQLTQ